MRPPGVLRIQNPELSGYVACPTAASCPRAGGHRVSRGWCRRGRKHVRMPTLCALALLARATQYVCARRQA